MKRVVLAVTLLLASLSSMYAQSSAEYSLFAMFMGISDQYIYTDDGVAVQKVISGVGTKEQLYDKVLHFLHRYYKDSTDVIQVNDKENGLIVANGYHSFYINEINFGNAVKHNIFPTIKAECKDERVRVTITIDYIDEFRKGSKGYNGAPDKPSTTDRVFIPDLYKSYKTIDDAQDRRFPLFDGFQIYHCIQHMLYLTTEIDNAINKTTVLATDDNW